MIKQKYLLTLAMLGLLVSLDQLTKFLVTYKFRLGETLEIIPGFFNLTLVHNPGAAFGFLATAPENVREPILLFLPFVTLIFIFFFMFKMRDSQKLSIFALALIIGGACGNLIDRLRMGYVVDFLDVHWQYRHHFPAFNVADSAITVGVTILILNLFFEKEPPPEGA